ncbi:MAG: peptidylprolyl isomerase [Reinekea sp.]|jgi:peptidyl-prolyl cis-trans isomerase SurA
MKTLRKVTGLITGLVLSSALFAQTLDRIVAVVNNDVVTEQQLTQRVATVRDQYRANPSVLPNDEILNREVLNALILESLQLQLAERGNLVLPDEQIDEAINSIAQRQNMTREQFTTALLSSDQSISEFRDRIRNELTIREVQKQVLSRQIFVSDAEVNRFLTSQTGQTLQDTEYQLSYIRFDASEKTQADKLVKRLNDTGESLLEVEGSRDLGIRKLDEIPSVFRTLVPVLNENETVAVERDNVIHIAQLANKSNTEQVNIDEYHIRHILISTNALFDAASAKALLTDLKQRIEAGDDMAALADQYSDDTGTKGRGGDLDWNTLDTFVPQFADAAKSLPVGAVSDIIESPFGFHILRVEDVRTRDVGLDVLRNQIKNQIFQRRYSETLQRWLTELRAQSFVEIRL